MNNNINTNFTEHNILDNSIITIEQLGDYINYTCNITKSFIIFEKINDTLSINNTSLDWNEPKLTINLLNFSLNDVIKKVNVKYFIYSIMKDEQHLLDMTKWEIVKDDNIILELKCPIENSIENVLHGFIH